MKARTFKRKVEKKFNSPDDNLDIVPKTSPRDHEMYSLYYKGKVIGMLQITRSSKEFGKKLISLMARQLGLSSYQLVGIEKCNFWAKDFVVNSRLIQNKPG